MNDNVFYIEIPVMGKQEIRLYDESKQIYTLFEDEILRLKDIMQLGPLHYFSEKLFKYTRYDHILTMLLLISRLEELGKLDKLKIGTMKRKLSTGIKLNGVKFSSISELLKSWTLLYALGHFQMTFAAEHAFLRWIKSKEMYEPEFLDILKEQTINSRLLKGDPCADALYNELEKIIKQERVMQVYKIFTFLKILKRTEEIQDEQLLAKLRELVKFMIFRKRYPDYCEDPNRKTREHVDKIKNIVDYFLILRTLSFTVLDGYIAQSPIQLTYHVALDSLPLFIEDENYRNMLNNVGSFYTKTLYQSTEGAYYHLEAMKIIEDMFLSQYNSVEKFVQDALSNKIDKSILKKIESKSKQIATKRHQGSINEMTSTSIELGIPRLSRPISKEIKYFGRVSGTVLYNIAEKKYQVFVYPRLTHEENPLKRIYDLLKISEILYEPLVEMEVGNRDFIVSARRNTRLLERAIEESSKIASYILGEVLNSEVVIQRTKLPLSEVSAKLSSTKSRTKFKLLEFIAKHGLFPFELHAPCLIPSKYLSVYLQQTDLLEVDSRDASPEQYHLLKTLNSVTTMNFEWYLMSLNTKVVRESTKKAELDVLVAGFSPRHLMISISEVKSGKQRQDPGQLKRYENILDDLKVRFEDYGYNVGLESAKGGRDIKTYILHVLLDTGSKI